MTIAAVVDLIESLRQSKLLDAQQLGEVAALQARFADPRDLARHLIQKGWLTPYQMNQLFQGKGADLILGQYVILERLGEGGMGQVFKARHQRLDRIVALKIIRKERLDNPKAVKRFQREMRAAAQLVHPNIVMAFDADQSGQTHFFAMEYVHGIDLNRLVKEAGPLPVVQACDYIRQAALGLQHAFERGLVHRDIKPANLLVEGVKHAGREADTQSLAAPNATHAEARYGRVKILDMGLARLAASDESNEVISRLTQEGTVMGTPDFIAPEQAMNSSNADIRADLYSLGCTFHFLLSGRVPFPGGTLMEKLIRHRNDAPEAIEKLRADVPPRVAAIVRKLLAKTPEERFQTPAEVVTALDAALQSGPPQSTPSVSVPVAGLDATPAPAGLKKRRAWPYVLAGLGAGLGFLLLFCIIVSLAMRGSTSARKPAPKLSALDRLDPTQVKREPGTPEDAVALLGRDGRHPLSLAFDAEGNHLASGGDDNLARVWEFPSLEETVLTPRHGGPVPGVAFPPHGNLLATVSYDAKLYLWNIAQTGFPVIGSWEADRFEADVVAFGPDGTTLATGGADHVVRLWKYEHERMSTPEQLRGHDGPVFALAFSPNGRRLASAGRDRSVRLWDVSARKAVQLAQLGSLPAPIASLSFSTDGKTLAGGGRDGVVRLWHVEERNLRAGDTHAQHSEGVNAVAFSPDAGALASAGQDGQLILWDLGKQTRRSWTLPPPLHGLAFAPDTRHVAVAAGNGRIYILRIAK